MRRTLGAKANAPDTKEGEPPRAKRTLVAELTSSYRTVRTFLIKARHCDPQRHQDYTKPSKSPIIISR